MAKEIPMSKLPPTLLSLSLALALATTPAVAQQVSTSQGVRTLPRTEGMTSEGQLRQALASSEQILAEVLRDIEAIDRARTSATGDASGLAEKVKLANADYERAKTAFEKIDKQYRDDLAAFQQRQSAHEADIQNQRNQAAAVEALPSAQRDVSEVYRLNDWAAKIGKERQAIDADRTRLLADHAKVEAERVGLEQQRLAAEAKLKAARDNVVGEAGGVEEKRNNAYAQLRTTVRSVEGLLAKLSVATGRREPRSQLLENAASKLRAWELRAR
jgi:predicted  nucleic acid-binding Zn-ribbon protein